MLKYLCRPELHPYHTSEVSTTPVSPVSDISAEFSLCSHGLAECLVFLLTAAVLAKFKETKDSEVRHWITEKLKNASKVSKNKKQDADTDKLLQCYKRSVILLLCVFVYFVFYVI